jgi:hypothetical protein
LIEEEKKMKKMELKKELEKVRSIQDEIKTKSSEVFYIFGL